MLLCTSGLLGMLLCTRRLRVTRGALRTAPARALPRSARAEAKLIDGKAIAADVREEVRVGVADMKEKVGKVPGT